MAVLDTAVFLDLRGRSGKKRQAQAAEVIQRLSQIANESLVTTRINVAELYVGIELADNPEAEKKLVDGALKGMEILELTESGALEFARIRADLQQKGRLVGDLDMLIAAIAMINAEKVVTGNRKHFEIIPGLNLISYGS